MSERTWGEGQPKLFTDLIMAANTNPFIDWDRMAGLPKGRGLTERQRCTILLAAINGDRVTFGQWNQLVGAEVVKGADTDAFLLPAYDKTNLAFTLDELIKGRKGARAEMAEEMAGVVSKGVVLVPQWTKATGRTDRIVARNIRSAIGYALWLLLDESKPFGNDLCKCQYTACGRYFFKIKGEGAPIRKYCQPEHAVLGDREAAAKRMRKLRR